MKDKRARRHKCVQAADICNQTHVDASNYLHVYVKSITLTPGGAATAYTTRIICKNSCDHWRA